MEAVEWTQVSLEAPTDIKRCYIKVRLPQVTGGSWFLEDVGRIVSTKVEARTEDNELFTLHLNGVLRCCYGSYHAIRNDHSTRFHKGPIAVIMPLCPDMKVVDRYLKLTGDQKITTTISIKVPDCDYGELCYCDANSDSVSSNEPINVDLVVFQPMEVKLCSFELKMV